MEQLRAAIYIRQSRFTEGSVSEEIQRENCHKLAESNGWKVVAEFKDIDISGGSTKGRDGLAELRKAHAAGAFDIALADDLSRFARNVSDSSVIRAEMPTATWKEGKQDNVLFADLLSAFNADYLRQISARWNDALRNRLEKGLPPSGKAQFGYDKVNGSYVINEAQAAILREAYERYTAGESARMICNDFSARGLEGAGARGWYQSGFLDLLDKDFYAGKIVWKDAVVEGSHEPILTPAQWAAYKDARKKRATNQRPKDPKWFGAGLVRCGRCEAVMVTHKDAKGVYQLMCAAYSMDRSKCKGVFRKRSVVATRIWFWLGAHLEEWASAMPTDEEGLIAAQTALADAEAALEAATEDYTGFATWAYENKILPSVSATQLEAKAQAVKEAEEARNSALAAVGSYTPAADVHEQILKGGELMGFSEDGEVSEEATARLRQALESVIEKVLVLPSSTASPRDPKRDWASEIVIVPKGDK